MYLQILLWSTQPANKVTSAATQTAPPPVHLILVPCFCSRDGVVLACEILDCCPWFEFADLDTYVSDEEGDGVSTTPDSCVGDTDDSGLDDDSRWAPQHACTALMLSSLKMTAHTSVQ